ncbi:MAG: major facilitator superfamily domain-containing protein [Piptocephalis tieghemiana]|nr:MAG: major facilitator superfamily domain-containing protein [Piptocephalis tieghemiana]
MPLSLPWKTRRSKGPSGSHSNSGSPVDLTRTPTHDLSQHSTLHLPSPHAQSLDPGAPMPSILPPDTRPSSPIDPGATFSGVTHVPTQTHSPRPHAHPNHHGSKPPTVSGSETVRAQALLPDFSEARLWVIVTLIAIAGLISPLASNIYLPALLSIEKDLNTTDMVINASVAIFVFGTGIFPLGWAVLSDSWGRKPIYLASILIYTVTSVACGLSQNVAMLLVFRLLQSVGGSAPITLGAAVITDIYPPARRGTAVGIFYLGPLIGPIIGPILGGYLDEAGGWRCIFWLLTGFGGLLFLAILFLYPETLPRKRLHAAHPDLPYSRPPPRNLLKSFLVLKFPTVAISTTYLGLIFGCLYLVTTNVPRLFHDHYGLSSSDTGLTYLAYGVGNVLGSVGGGRLTDLIRRRTLAKLISKAQADSPIPIRPEDVHIRPEVRLIASYPGIIGVPLGLVGYGWSVDRSVHLAVPLLFFFIIGCSMQLSMASINTFIVDAFSKNAAAAISISNFLRYVTAGVCILIAEPLVNAMGVGPLMSMLAGLCILTGMGIVCIQLYGAKWRNTDEEDEPEEAQMAATRRETSTTDDASGTSAREDGPKSPQNE